MEWVSAAEAAELWGVSERSVRNYCAQGRVPGARLIGKTWSIPAGTAKPLRANARSASSPLLQRLREEKAAGVRGGIYHKIQVELTYNSSHIEGSTLTLDQTRHIFETATFEAADQQVSVDDIIETTNHFRAVDFVIDHADEPLSEGMVKELHRILKQGTSDERLEWFEVGGYKRLPNEVGGRQATAPEHVGREVAAALKAYEPKAGHSLEQIVAFHVAFERIHPFQDGNGRVGRLIMFKECLASRVTPFIISDDLKLFCYRGLSKWDDERGYLMDTCLTAQDRFCAALDYFQIPHASSEAACSGGLPRLASAPARRPTAHALHASASSQLG